VTFVSSFNDSFLPKGQHFYGPNLCAKYQERMGDDVKVDLYTSGCPFEDKPTGLYKNWRIPLTVKPNRCRPPCWSTTTIGHPLHWPVAGSEAPRTRLSSRRHPCHDGSR